MNGFSSSNWPETNFRRRSAATAAAATAYSREGGGVGIQLAVGPQPLWLRNHNSGPAQRIMVKRLATSPHDPLGITDSACKNQCLWLLKDLVTTDSACKNQWLAYSTVLSIHISRSDQRPLVNHSIGYPRMSASGESSTTMHRILHASGSHPIPMPYDPNRLFPVNFPTALSFRCKAAVFSGVFLRSFKTPTMCVPAVAVGINWSSSASLYFSRWCISAYPAVACDQLLPSAVALSFIHSISIISFAIHCFPGYSAGRGFDPAGGAPGGR
ncbi:isoamylase 2, chloroplastic-like [Dorcoceras hygrometricum]|uniref:Isoamylase 2, chloroplastic-like n=1 Tax=Dorcoceras hygrometricum TaxID=472368 RepID=A0A2Z7BKG6_9LAMI|nr:isoamylase 2, chloroplastic-like [Dorcoceras hygrometricum]